MSQREKGMAKLLSRPSRAKRFNSVIEKISQKASTILDLGCGVGALTAKLNLEFPSVLIVGVDRSKFLLRKSQLKGIALTVLADIENLPLRDNFFDVAVAIQVLHEVMSLKGTHALIRTLKDVGNSLKSGGEIIILDHVSPGDSLIQVELSEEMLTKFMEFQVKFKHRKIICQDHGEGMISISLRDLNDFITKIWALNSDLEEEEMNETHTPFTCKELEDLLLKANFKVEQVSILTHIHPRKGITIQSKVKLPARQIVMLARK